MLRARRGAPSRRLGRLAAVTVATAVLVAACGGDGSGSDAGGDGSAVPPPATGDDAGTGTPTAEATPTGDLDDCPTGFRDGDLAAGSHDAFASGGQDRSFHLLLPDAAAEPAPLFVSLTGTVQEEEAFLAQSELDQLPDDGWVVVAPVRNQNGLVWGPWDAMRTPAMTGPNPDEELVLDLVACIAAHHPIDPARVFVGGISVGGTFVNHLLRRHSEVFAGGIVGSGNFILTAPPEPEPLDAMTVIVAWGGDGDEWTGCPDGRMGEEYATVPGCTSVSFVADAADAAEYYASEPEVALLACSQEVGHIWITDATRWWAGVLASRPKGTDAPLDPGAAPPPMTCSTEAP